MIHKHYILHHTLLILETYRNQNFKEKLNFAFTCDAEQQDQQKNLNRELRINENRKVNKSRSQQLGLLEVSTQ